MTEFDKDYWQTHWQTREDSQTHDRQGALPVNPYLKAELAQLPRGTALDAGCGRGAEALWLAQHGWTVTAADISETALQEARSFTATAPHSDQITWVKADLSRWEPNQQWDLVVTNYAHAEIGQLPLYQRLATWVAPGGTLLIVGHLHDTKHHNTKQHDTKHHNTEQHHPHPHSATATSKAITDLFNSPDWQVEAAYENTRTVSPGGSPVQLNDVVVRVHRLP